MKDILKDIYKEAYLEDVKDYQNKDYYYFMDKEQNVFGLLKEKINQNEKRLIQSFYRLLDDTLITKGKIDVLDYLFGRKELEQTLESVKYYFLKIYDTLDQDIEQALFDILNEFFINPLLIMKKKGIYIVVLNDQEEIDFYNFLKSIESDFMIKLIGFESDELNQETDIPLIFQQDFNSFIKIKYSDEFLLSKASLLRTSILSNISDMEKNTIKKYILGPFSKDYEMINIIKAYFETNFNTTMAAKKCYMHRNTFLNKIDKFIQETKFNLRDYEDAFVVYLAIIL